MFDSTKRLQIEVGSSVKTNIGLPRVYSNFLLKSLTQAPIHEVLATCDDCSMQTPDKNGISYKAHLKCCTYHPFEPNFLIGGVLSESKNKEVLQVIKNKIEACDYVLPIGIVPNIPLQVHFNARVKMEFGNREDWLCPYYDRGLQNCGLWGFRSAVCTTFFCKSSYGKRGVLFWESLSDFLTYVEMALLEEALVMLDFSPRQLSENLIYLNRFDASKEELKQKVLPKDKAVQLWNGYFDDQIGFFKKTYSIVANLNRRQFQTLIGDQGIELEKMVLKNLRQLEK